MPKNEIVIARLPGRTGLYLGFHRGVDFETIARFTRGEESAEKFVDWAKSAGIQYINPKEEGK